MKNNFRISVIIPVYNQEAYLTNCLDSLVKQDYQNIEFLLIDDGSTDNSYSICKRYCQLDSRFIYIRQENRGVSAARNVGLNIATGAYIGFCDADDWVEPNMYSFLYGLIEDNNADIAICGYDDNGCMKDVGGGILSLTQAMTTLLDDNTFGGFMWNKLFRRETLKDLRFDPNIHICEDMLFNFFAYINATKIVFSYQKLYHYSFNPQSALHTAFNSKKWSGLEARLQLLKLTSRYVPQCMSIAQRNVFAECMYIAKELVLAKQLNKEKYKRLKKIIGSCNYNCTKSLLSTTMRLEVQLFMHSRLFFIMCYKLLRKR